MKALKITAIVSGVLAALQLAPFIKGVAMRIQWLSGAGAVGIIGGADGPTAIYIASKSVLPLVLLRYALLTASLIAFLVSVILLIKNRNKE